MNIILTQDVFGMDERIMRPYAIEAGTVFEDGEFERVELDNIIVKGSFGDDGEEVTVCIPKGYWTTIEDDQSDDSQKPSDDYRTINSK